MDEKVFTQENVSQFLNKHFVNWKLQFDKTNSDSKEIQSLYKEVERFKNDYRVQVFPSYLIFDSKGILVHHIVGGTEANLFLTKLSERLNPETQYERLIKEFEKDKSNPDVIKKVLTQAQRNHDVLRSNEVLEALINVIGKEKVLTAEYLPFVINSARNSTSYSFGLIRDNKAIFDQYLLPQKANSDLFLSSVLIYELVIPLMQNESNEEIDFDQLQSNIEKEHPYVDIKPMMMRAKIQYYSSKGQWSDMVQSVNDYLVLMGDNINREDIKMYAQILMKGTSDIELQEQAKKWLELEIK